MGPIDNPTNVSEQHRICNTCVKKDVCMYKPQVEKAEADINKISERPNVCIEVSIKCKHWLGEQRVNIR